MTKEAKRRNGGLKRMALAALIVGAAAVVNSAVHAATAQTDSKSTKETATFDPFSLKTVMTSNTSSSGKVSVASESASVNRVRQPIRVPSRPTYRSAFRPGLDWRTAGT
jgi:hypothetical protein